MDSGSCCIDSSSSSSSSAAAAAATSHQQPPLQRMGSGTSTLTISDAAGGADAESRKLPSSKYKGVVPQPNGRWGAQIYEKHQRVWLGTFNLERDAARAYDVAAQRFRGRDAATNFPPLFLAAASVNPDGAAHELAFLLSRSKAEIVDMLRKHTYADELRHSLRQSPPQISAVSLPAAAEPPAREHLFDKAVTPSDVGKLNRLVIPKQHAEKHFPTIGGDGDGNGPKGMLLTLEDGGGKVWRFRYSYWNSSQSYVLTKGWSRFVKEKGLKAGDTVAFHCSQAGDRQLYIECHPRCSDEVALPLQRAVRLFGVDIGKVAAVAAVAAVNENGKRTLETVKVPAAGSVWLKKQCAVGL